MTTDLSQKSPKNFKCELCHYITSYSKDYNKHLLTNKHINNANNGSDNANVLPEKNYVCNICAKCYKDRAGLWRHKKKCINNYEKLNNNEEKEEITDKQLVMMLLKQNSELIKEQSDIKELILEIVKNGNTNTNTNNSYNTTNSHNKAFNLNFFLNETCKNAMNITDFVDSIKLQLSDFINVGEVGFIEGISNIIVKNLNSLDETIRPIHCTDQKRETFYVKDENKWEKEEEDKKRLKKMIKGVVFKNENLMKTYKETYPDYNDANSRRSDQYSKTVIEAMDCKEESREKIIKNISKVTTIKQKV
jgi:hypothetical protein